VSKYEHSVAKSDTTASH